MSESYTDILEKQNEELKKQLAQVELESVIWKPHWVEYKQTPPVWKFEVYQYSYGLGSVTYDKEYTDAPYKASYHDVKWFPTLEEAKSWVEYVVTKEAMKQHKEYTKCT